MLLLPIGAMAGSTAGGVKLIRVLAVASYAHREALRHLHPRLVRPVRVGGAIVPDRTANKIVGFLMLALATFGGGAMVIALTGPDIVTSFSAAATAFGNVGPGSRRCRTDARLPRAPPVGALGHDGPDVAGSSRDLPGDPGAVGGHAAPSPPLVANLTTQVARQTVAMARRPVIPRRRSD